MHIGDVKMTVSVYANINSVMPLTEKVGRSPDGANRIASGNNLPEEGLSLISTSLNGVENSGQQMQADREKETSDSPTEINELRAQVDKANETMSMRLSNLQFTVAEGTDIPVVRIEDAETGELIRQIPSEEMVALSKALDELKHGMLLEEKA
jgi:flagellar protein FlaG